MTAVTPLALVGRAVTAKDAIAKRSKGSQMVRHSASHRRRTHLAYQQAGQHHSGSAGCGPHHGRVPPSQPGRVQAATTKRSTCCTSEQVPVGRHLQLQIGTAAAITVAAAVTVVAAAILGSNATSKKMAHASVPMRALSAHRAGVICRSWCRSSLGQAAGKLKEGRLSVCGGCLPLSRRSKAADSP